MIRSLSHNRAGASNDPVVSEAGEIVVEVVQTVMEVGQGRAASNQITEEATEEVVVVKVYNSNKTHS